MTAPYKADVTAAERLLKAAVREARRQIAEGDAETVSTLQGPVFTYRTHDRAAVVQMLAEAGRSADLLLGGAR